MAKAGNVLHVIARYLLFVSSERQISEPSMLQPSDTNVYTPTHFLVPSVNDAQAKATYGPVQDRRYCSDDWNTTYMARKENSTLGECKRKCNDDVHCAGISFSGWETDSTCVFCQTTTLSSHRDWASYLKNKAPDPPAPGGTCYDPDPNKDSSTDYICPKGYQVKHPAVPSGTCEDVDSCNANCCDEVEPYTYLGEGLCRDVAGHGSPYYDQAGHTDATCMAQCDADPLCEGYQFTYEGLWSGGCAIFGSKITVPAPGWERGYGDGGIVTTVLNSVGKYCKKKSQVETVDTTYYAACADRVEKVKCLADGTAADDVTACDKDCTAAMPACSTWVSDKSQYTCGDCGSIKCCTGFELKARENSTRFQCVDLTLETEFPQDCRTCQQAINVIVTSIDHPVEGETGRYFYFNIDNWAGVFGVAPTDGEILRVEQWRDGIKMWTGNVKVWVSSDTGVHGRRDSGQLPWQWRTNDVIRKSTTSEATYRADCIEAGGVVTCNADGTSAFSECNAACAAAMPTLFKLLGSGFCRPGDCNIHAATCRSNGYRKSGSSSSECSDQCKFDPNCIAYSFDPIGHQKWCYIHTENDEVPSNWDPYRTVYKNVGATSSHTTAGCFTKQACLDDVEGFQQATGKDWSCSYYSNGGCDEPQVDGNDVMPRDWCYQTCDSCPQEGNVESSLQAVYIFAHAFEWELAVAAYIISALGICSMIWRRYMQDEEFQEGEEYSWVRHFFDAGQCRGWHIVPHAAFFIVYVTVSSKEILANFAIMLDNFWRAYQLEGVPSKLASANLQYQQYRHLASAFKSIFLGSAQIGRTIVCATFIAPWNAHRLATRKTTLSHSWYLRAFGLIILYFLLSGIAVSWAINVCSRDDVIDFMLNEFFGFVHMPLKLATFTSLPRQIAFIREYSTKPVEELIQKLQASPKLSNEEWTSILKDYKAYLVDLYAACSSCRGILVTLKISQLVFETVGWGIHFGIKVFGDSHAMAGQNPGITMYALTQVFLLVSYTIIIFYDAYRVNPLTANYELETNYLRPDSARDTLLGALNGKICDALDAGEDATGAFDMHQYVAWYPPAWYVWRYQFDEATLYKLGLAMASPLLVKIGVMAVTVIMPASVQSTVADVASIDMK